MRNTLHINRICGNNSSYRMLQVAILSLIFLLSSTLAGAETMVPLIVTKGTGLIKLARKFCTSEYHWKELARLNNLQPPYRIFPGDQIYVPIELLKVEKVSGHVAAVAGSVYLLTNDTKLKKVVKGDTIVPGQTMVTEEDGFAHIIFPNNKYTRVSSNSRFSLTYMVNLIDDSLKAEFYLKKGRIIHAVREKLKPTESFQTRTPVSVTGVRGTEFRVKMLGDSINVIETLQGSVEVDGSGGRAVVTSGSGSIIERGKPPGKPQKLPPVPPALNIEKIFQSLPVTIPTLKDNVADQYRIRVAWDDTGKHTVFEQIVKSGKSFKFFTLGDGIYFGFLTSITAEGLESRPSKPFEFQIRTIPAPPILSNPYKGKSLFQKTVSIEWLVQENVEKYRLQLSSIPDFSIVLDDWYHTGSRLTLKDLRPGEYFIRIQAIAEDGLHSLFSTSDYWKIEVEPSLTDMEGSFEKGLVLEWADMGEGITYDLQVSTKKTFTSTVTETSGLKTPKFTYKDKLEPGTYYIRLRGVLGDGQQSPWSIPNSIKIDNPPFSIFDGTILTLFLSILLLI